MPNLLLEIQNNDAIKKYSCLLPCPIHRFLEFQEVKKDFILPLFNNDEDAIKTPWLRLSKRIGKIDRMLEYLPKLTVLGQEDGFVKYGSKCIYKDQ